MPGTENDSLLAAGLLAVCKQLLGRVRVLEELVQSDPDLAAKWKEQRRFQAAFEEDEYKELVEGLRTWLEALREVDLADATGTSEPPDAS